MNMTIHDDTLRRSLKAPAQADCQGPYITIEKAGSDKQDIEHETITLLQLILQMQTTITVHS